MSVGLLSYCHPEGTSSFSKGDSLVVQCHYKSYDHDYFVVFHYRPFFASYIKTILQLYFHCILKHFLLLSTLDFNNSTACCILVNFSRSIMEEWRKHVNVFDAVTFYPPELFHAVPSFCNKKGKNFNDKFNFTWSRYLGFILTNEGPKEWIMVKNTQTLNKQERGFLRIVASFTNTFMINCTRS